MAWRAHIPLLIVVGGLFSSTACEAQPAGESMKLLRVGSSSFPYLLIEDIRNVVEASGSSRIVCDKADDTGYTRLDQFVTQPGLYEEWCREQMPRIKAGHYDYVIIQTIGWLGLQPEQQNRLCLEILPNLVHQMRAAGAEVILYDKYLPVESEQKDAAARKWCLRYPEGYKLNYLLHIMAARRAGIEKISFGGQAVTEVWQQEHFKRLKFLYCDPSHPGPMANHISALNLSWLLTGREPAGCPVRDLPLTEGRQRSFLQTQASGKPGDAGLFQENKDRIRDGVLTLRDEEAGVLQQAAMASQRQWGTLLRECLESDERFSDVMDEIRRLQSQMGKYEEYGLDPGRAAALREKFAAPSSPGELPPSLIAKIRRKSRSIEYAGADVRNYFRKYLTREQQREAADAYAEYWQRSNSKLRDELYFGCRVLIEKALRQGERDEAARLQQACGVLHMTLSFPAFLLLFDRVGDEAKRVILEDYQITGLTKRSSPLLAAYLNENHQDEAALVAAWKVYMKIWSDADLMDELRDSGYALGVIQKVDREFVGQLMK